MFGLVPYLRSSSASDERSQDQGLPGGVPRAHGRDLVTVATSVAVQHATDYAGCPAVANLSTLSVLKGRFVPWFD